MVGWLDLEAVIPLEEGVEEKGWGPCKHSVHISPWILIRGGCMSWTFILLMLWLVDISEIIGFLIWFFPSLLRRKLKEHKMGQQLRLEGTLDRFLSFLFFF